MKKLAERDIFNMVMKNKNFECCSQVQTLYYVLNFSMNFDLKWKPHLSRKPPFYSAFLQNLVSFTRIPSVLSRIYSKAIATLGQL